MVDPERLHRLLRRVTDRLAVLHTYARVEPRELQTDDVRLGHVKYLFVTMLEGCIDAAQHVCASEGYGPAHTNADALRLLVDHEVLDRETGAAMVEAVGFRNVLVHGYAEVDDDLVVANLEHLGDAEGFVAALARLLGANN